MDEGLKLPWLARERGCCGFTRELGITPGTLLAFFYFPLSTEISPQNTTASDHMQLRGSDQLPIQIFSRQQQVSLYTVLSASSTVGAGFALNPSASAQLQTLLHFPNLPLPGKLNTVKEHPLPFPTALWSLKTQLS